MDQLLPRLVDPKFRNDRASMNFRIQFSDSDFGEVSATLITYHSQNRVTQKRQRFDTIIGSAERLTIVTYNEHGDKVEECATSNRSPEARTVRYDYQYDKHGKLDRTERNSHKRWVLYASP